MASPAVYTGMRAIQFLTLWIGIKSYFLPDIFIQAYYSRLGLFILKKVRPHLYDRKNQVVGVEKSRTYVHTTVRSKTPLRSDPLCCVNVGGRMAAMLMRLQVQEEPLVHPSRVGDNAPLCVPLLLR